MPSAPTTFAPVARTSRADADRARGSSAARGYGAKWQRARAGYLAKHPWCACGCGGRATDVDHIKPHRGDMRLFWDSSNWQGLTKACHSAKTGRGS